MQNTPHPLFQMILFVPNPLKAPIIPNKSALKKKICIGDMENLNLG